jgi:hypothetical protein
MRLRRKLKIIPRWEPERRFAILLRHHAPIARRAPDFFLEHFFRLQEEEAQRLFTPLQ